MKIKKIFICILLLLVFAIFYSIKEKNKSLSNINNEKTIVENLTIKDTVKPDLIIDEEVIKAELNKYKSQQQEEKEEEEELETYTTMYSKVGLNIRKEPNLSSEIVNVASINAELQIVDNSDDGEWTKIKKDENYYYVASKYLSTEKVKVEIKPQIASIPVSRSSSSINNNTGVLTKSKGVNYYNGHRETWYSQKVLPGGGLQIPGRHVDNRGLVCDGDGYICVASNDYPKGTIVETSLGAGKVYDCGCPKNTIDIYCNW